MNCANHPDAPAVAYCRTCGKPLCNTCARDVRGVVYCEECLASHLAGTIPPAAAVVPPVGERPPGTPSPALATVLGFIPGVGAMYNGEFAKGFVHVLIFATLIWMTDHVNDLFGIAIAAFYIYMPIEAYKTARAREMGLPAPDPLGLNNIFRSGPPPAPAASMPAAAASAPGTHGDVPPAGVPDEAPRSRVPFGAFVLIGLGVLFLLGEMNLLRIDWLFGRLWPLILIAIGVRILMQRQRRGW